MATSALAGATVLEETQAIKISSKRQITIPAKAYREMGFKDYALCTWTDKGLLIEPLDVDDEDVTVSILRNLIAEGYDGEELIEKYQEVKPKVISVQSKLDEAEKDISEGKLSSYEEMRDRIKDTYGV